MAGSSLGSLDLAAYGGGGRDGKFVEWVGDGTHVFAGQVQIDGGVPDVGVAEQFLDSGKVGAGFEKMRGVAVSTISSKT